MGRGESRLRKGRRVSFWGGENVPKLQAVHKLKTTDVCPLAGGEGGLCGRELYLDEAVIKKKKLCLMRSKCGLFNVSTPKPS